MNDLLAQFLEDSEFISKIILIGVSVIGGLLLHRRAAKLEKSGRKFFFLGIAVFGYLFGLTRALFLYTDLPDVGRSNPLWRVGWVLSLLSIAAIVVVIETYIMKTKYVFTVVAIIGVVLTILLQPDQLKLINAAVSGILLADVLAAYTYVAIKSEGTPRTRAIKSFLGISLIAVGLLIDGFSQDFFIGLDISVIGVSLMIVGLILYLRTISES